MWIRMSSIWVVAQMTMEMATDETRTSGMVRRGFFVSKAMCVAASRPDMAYVVWTMESTKTKPLLLQPVLLINVVKTKLAVWGWMWEDHRPMVTIKVDKRQTSAAVLHHGIQLGRKVMGTQATAKPQYTRQICQLDHS